MRRPKLTKEQKFELALDPEKFRKYLILEHRWQCQDQHLGNKGTAEEMAKFHTFINSEKGERACKILAGLILSKLNR